MKLGVNKVKKVTQLELLKNLGGSSVRNWGFQTFHQKEVIRISFDYGAIFLKNLIQD